MKLSHIPRLVGKKKRRLGLGHGSSRGKTAGRGTKGQNARGKMPLAFEGGSLSLLKRLPFRRGREKNKVFKKRPVIINLKTLNLLPKNSTIDIETLVKYNIVDAGDAKMYGIKILGEGDVQIPLTLRLSASKSAIEKIKKAGGQVEHA